MYCMPLFAVASDLDKNADGCFIQGLLGHVDVIGTVCTPFS